MTKYVVRPAYKTKGEEPLYEAVASVTEYFTENPNELYVDLIIDNDGQTETIGRVENPALLNTIASVSYALDRYRMKTAVRTVEIKK